MKISNLHIVLFVGIIISALLVSKYNQDNEELGFVTKSSYDSLLIAHKKIDQELDSISKVKSKTDTVILHIKEFIYVKGEKTISLNANNTIRLFNEWTRYMHDSITRKGHFRPLPDTLN